jgi:hypothetical protein
MQIKQLLLVALFVFSVAAARLGNQYIRWTLFDQDGVNLSYEYHHDRDMADNDPGVVDPGDGNSIERFIVSVDLANNSDHDIEMTGVSIVYQPSETFGVIYPTTGTKAVFPPGVLHNGFVVHRSYFAFSSPGVGSAMRDSPAYKISAYRWGDLIVKNAASMPDQEDPKRTAQSVPSQSSTDIQSSEYQHSSSTQNIPRDLLGPWAIGKTENEVLKNQLPWYIQFNSDGTVLSGFKNSGDPLHGTFVVTGSTGLTMKGQENDSPVSVEWFVSGTTLTLVYQNGQTQYYQKMHSPPQF